MMINVEIFEDRDSGMGVSLRELGRAKVFFLSFLLLLLLFYYYYFFPSWQLLQLA